MRIFGAGKIFLTSSLYGKIFSKNKLNKRLRSLGGVVLCNVCGCGSSDIHHHHHDHDHHTGHHHSHQHDEQEDANHFHFGSNDAGVSVAGFSPKQLVTIERNILDKNQAFADSNRLHFQQNGVLAINLLSSPGAGKTSLLVQTIENLKENVPIFVIEGDQETENDAQRIRATGSQAVQINTGKGCHLDAHMVGHALESLQFSSDSLLMIENVGNLVCPASFDLGESYKVVILSVTEGEDKPIKYPDMFAASDLMIVNKIDLLPYLKFDVDKAIEYARRVNPSIEIIQLSVETGQGMKLWTQWLLSHMQSAPVDFLRDSETTESASHA